MHEFTDEELAQLEAKGITVQALARFLDLLLYELKGQRLTILIVRDSEEPVADGP